MCPHPPGHDAAEKKVGEVCRRVWGGGGTLSYPEVRLLGFQESLRLCASCHARGLESLPRFRG